MEGRHRPEGGKEAIDRAVAAVTFVERPLASGVVDERHPVLAQVVGERDHSQDLGQDLEHIDVRPAGVELANEPLRDRPRIIPHCVADADDVAPAVGRPV